MKLKTKKKFMNQNEITILKKGHNLSFDELFDLSKPEMNEIINYFGSEKVYALLYQKIQGDLPSKCIYGHLTENCNSLEAEEFIKNNVKVHIHHNYDTSIISNRSATYFTPLELYIYPTKEEYYLESEQEADESGDFEELYSLDSYTQRIIKVKEYLKNLIIENN